MSYNQELLKKVSKLYYVENLKQESITRKLNISRYKVRKVLKRARDNGFIEIKIVNPNNKNK